MAFILCHVVIVLVVSGALWLPHWYHLTTPKHDYRDSRVLGWISGSILGHLGCHGPPNGTIFRSQVLGELACSVHLGAGWHSSFRLHQMIGLGKWPRIRKSGPGGAQGLNVNNWPTFS